MKKGFTLIELLAVIVILAIILAIAIPGISNIVNSAQTAAYADNEKLLSSTAKNYVTVNNSLIPADGSYASVIKLSDLVTNNYISQLNDVKDKSIICDGYVLVKKESVTSNEKYYPYLKCSNNYTTVGYSDSIYNSTKVLLVDVLVVAGGSGGGSSGGYIAGYSGGGGAGGLIYQTNVATSITTHNIVVGAGGAVGTNGENSSALGLVAVGGGHEGTIGGSGGGGSGVNGIGGNGTVGQGNSGGTGQNSTSASAGGGGGAGGAGANGVCNSNGASGGIGLQYNISGTAQYYAGGGGGGVEGGSYTGGIGGLGGGGNGGRHNSPIPGGAGAANTGGGGGGGNPGGTGGSGIVIIRYVGVQKANGGTVTSVGGYTIHTFTNTGTSTFNVLDF